MFCLHLTLRNFHCIANQCSRSFVAVSFSEVMQSFLTHCVYNPIAIRLFRASSGIAALGVVAQVAWIGWQIYEDWKMTDAGQNIMWHQNALLERVANIW